MHGESVRTLLDHSAMEQALNVLMWATVIAAAAVLTAVLFGVLLPS